MVNGKSFLIAEKPFEGMHTVELSGGVYLNWNDGLSVSVSKDKRAALIGECWSVIPGEEPADYIERSDDLTGEAILERENCWCGRYVLYLEDTVYMDAAGIMSVFYHKDYISNSLNLLRETLGYPLRKEQLYYGLLPDFVPGIDTRYDGVKRLMPSKTYSFRDKTVAPRTLLPELPAAFHNDEERAAEFIRLFTSGLVNMDRHFAGKIKLIACTGGKDSRANLAGALYAGLDWEMFLLEHRDISDADVEIAKELSHICGKKLHYIKRDRKKYRSARLKEFDRHTCNYVVDVDRTFYAYGQYEALREQVGGDIVVIRGSVWPIVCEKYDQISYDKITSLYKLLDYHTLYRESVEHWVDTAKNDPCNRAVSDGNRIFWELRESCYVSSLEQAFDIYDGIISVQPVNCRRLISLLIGFDRQDRMHKKHEEKMARSMFPAFAPVPYDFQIKKEKTVSKMNRLADLTKKSIWLLTAYGLKGLMGYIRN